MKQKDTTSLTKQDLLDVIKQLATKRDLDDIAKELRTQGKDINSSKNDLKSVRNELESLEIKIDIKLDTLKLDIDENSRHYRDQVLTKMDGVMKELGTIRQEQVLGNDQFNKLKEKIGNNEKRIKKVEQSIQTN